MAKPRVSLDTNTKSPQDDELTLDDGISVARRALRESIMVKEVISKETLEVVVNVSRLMTSILQARRKVVFLGNGGSAADAQHIAAELVGRLSLPRPALNAIALTTNSSSLTAISNDYGFEQVYSRQIEACIQEGDMVVGISTSGLSKNVVLALQRARELGATTVGFTGGSGGELRRVSDHIIIIPSNNVQRIQECHITIGHIICELVERMTVQFCSGKPRLANHIEA